MSLLGFEGWEGLETVDGALRGWDIIAGGVGAVAQITTGGINGRRLYLESGGVNGLAQSSARQVFPSGTEVVIGAAVRIEATNSSGVTGVFQIGEATATHVTVAATDTGQLIVYRGNIDGVNLGSSATSLFSEGGWFYLEARIKLSNTVGEVELFVEGEQVLSLSALDTINGGTGVADRLLLLASTTAGLSLKGIVSYDDVYWLDTAGVPPLNGPLGPVRVDRLLPNADVSTQFTPSSGGVNHHMVDEALPNNDTDYNESGTAGHKDVLGLSNLLTPSGTVFAVATRVRARRTDAAVTNIVPSIISNSVEANGVNVSVGSSYEELTDLFVSNPDGGGAWSDSAVNALQVAYRLP